MVFVGEQMEFQTYNLAAAEWYAEPMESTKCALVPGPRTLDPSLRPIPRWQFGGQIEREIPIIASAMDGRSWTSKWAIHPWPNWEPWGS